MVSKSCPTHDELLAYSLGRVSPGTEASLSEHLRDCVACLSILAELESEMDPLLSAVTRASLQPSSAELLGDEAIYVHGLTRTMALAGAGRAGCVASEVQDALEETQQGRLGQYELLEELGRGGMGIVYRARHLRLERIVALKILHGSRLDSVGAVERFQHEMKAVGKLDHPNIVQATDAGQADGMHYLAMEFVAGKNLSHALRDERGFPAWRSAELIRDVARGLHHAHQRGLVHRDIKPSNILLDRKGRARITDFGLVLTENDPADDLAYAGTPAYMSPEQARGEGHRVDGRSDIFSLGAVFYRLLTGQQPFEGRGIKKLCERIASVDPIRPSTIVSNVPEDLDRISMRALAKDPNERYATAGEMADELDSWLHHRDGLDRAATAANGDTLTLVPKGLEAYDRGDATFFLGLVPGPRDRSGLPEAIRFWKRGVEETDAERSFRIGVVRGPNGCGKTSLIRAGLLPKLAEHIIPVYVVATGRHTEAALMAKLQASFPLPLEDLNLGEMLAEVKHQVSEHADSKLLIVLDQFEQWLHVNRDFADSALVSALQLCDAHRVQCLLVVRDELWSSTTRFLEASGISMEGGVRCQAVDLLDLEHARSVLAAHGRAYGALPGEARDQTAEHVRFLDEAIGGLAEDGLVSPFRLTLFAETVKNVLWTRTSLRRMEGVHGTEIAFLQATFGAGSGRRKHRVHQQAARAVLAEICPAPGRSLCGSACDSRHLLKVSGYTESPRKFEELLSILNHRLKLISLVDPEDLTCETGASETEEDCRYYRLSHDYLVPIVRQWTTSRERRSLLERARLQLEECSARWAARPERRWLPTVWQWARIRLLTRKSSWSDRQREMMRQATRIYSIRLGIVAATVAIAVLLLAGWAQ